MNKKKLLVTASTFPRSVQDTEPTFILDLCKEYTKYYDVTALVPSDPSAKKYEVIDGVKIIRYRYFPIKKYETLVYPGAIVPRIKEKKIRALLVPFLFLGLIIALFRYLKEFDLVHANWIIPQGICQSLFRKKYILSGLGGDVTSLNSGILKKIKNFSLNKAQAVTVVSQDLANYLKEELALEDIHVIPMGVDLEKFKPENKDLVYFDSGNKNLNILFVGRLAEKKGARYLIEAFSKLNTPANLFIIGDGPERNFLENLAKNIPNIFFMGSKTKEELALAYASCDIYCIPSVYAQDGDKDGLPVAMIEAMASGAPIVASEIAGIPEVIKNKQNGLLVKEKNVAELAEALELLLTDRKLRGKLSVRARESALAYDFSNLAKEYKRLLENCL